MLDGLPRGYDEWRTRSREDDEDMEQARLAREAELRERADYEYDRQRDEPREPMDWLEADDDFGGE